MQKVSSNYAWLIPTIVWCVLWLLAFQNASANAVHHWVSNEIFHHGLLVLPLVVWSFWRTCLSASPQALDPLGFVLSLALFGIWLAGYVSQVMVLEQLAAVALVTTSAVTAFGWVVTLRAWFPLSLLLFAIPIGQEFIPFLQTLTTHLAELMLQAIGTTVFVEGLYIHAPVGVFHVAEACSGVKFLVACIFFGYVCAYAFFRTFNARATFMVFCILLPILANAIRVTITVLVGYWFGMEHVAGFDHLVYGWLLFAIVFGMIFFAAMHFGDYDRALEHSAEKIEGSQPRWSGVYAAFAPLMLAIAVQTPIGHPLLESELSSDLTLRSCASDWPGFTPEIERSGWVSECSDPVGEYVVYYDGINQSQELGAIWPQLIKENVFSVEEQVVDDSSDIPLTVSMLRWRGNYFAIAHWHQIGQATYVNQYLTMKMHQVLNMLDGRGRGGTFALVITRLDSLEDRDQAKAILRTSARRLGKRLGKLADSKSATD